MDNSSNRAAFFKLNSWNKDTVLTLLALGAIIWIAHYFHFRDLGLYEDDYAQIGPPLGWHLPDLENYLKWLLTWPQGRPLQYFLTGFLAFLGGKLGGLGSVYIFGFLVQITNVFLFYFLLRRISTKTVALIGAVFIGLYPADTTHTFLVHAFHLHTSLMFVLIASHLYLSGHKPLSYLVSLGCLLTYESAYMVFLAVPLLGQKWGKNLIREMTRHFVIWLGILLVIFVIRTALAEERVVTSMAGISNIGVIFIQTLQALAIGPAVSFWLFVYGPGRTLLGWNRELTYIFLGCLPLFSWLIFRSNFSSHSRKEPLDSINQM